MGAVCGRPNKPRPKPRNPYSDPYGEGPDSQKKETREIFEEQGLNPANTLDMDAASPHRLVTQTQREGFGDIGDRKHTEENLKESLLVQFNIKDSETMTTTNQQQKSTIKLKDTLLNLDQGQKGQLTPRNNEPIERPKSLMGPGTSIFNNHDKGGVSSIDNVFEPFYEEKEKGQEDFYLDMNETFMKKYEQFSASYRLNRLKSAGTPGAQSHSRTQSQLLEWSKLLQKTFNQEKSSNALENKTKLQKVYKIILGLDERNWYEEMAMLYKEKQAMSKNTGNMTGLTFDRKIIQLQEQFRWLISAIANTRLNPNQVGFHDFPPYRLPSRKKGDKLDTSVISIARGQNSATGSDDVSDIFSPIRPQQPNNITSARTQMGGFTYLENAPDPRENYYIDFPEIFSTAWQEGFIWKGVYLKLYSKKEAHLLKKELKVLKHMGVEYLQTETALKISEPLQSISLNANESSEVTKPLTSHLCHVLLPIISTVESSSWVLLGTPILPVKKNGTEDSAAKVSAEINNVFRNTFLLANITSRNLKIYHKPEEVQGQTHTFGNLGHSSYLPGNTSTGSGSMFVLLSNVSKVAFPLPKVNMMAIISQEINSNISFLECPKRNLDLELLKKALGYADEEIGIDGLLAHSGGKSGVDRESKGQPDLYFEMIRFKRRGWLMQMIYVRSRKSLPPTFAINKRAMDLLSHSDSNKMIEIKGNALLFGNLPNTTSLIHPYYISEQTYSSIFFEEAAGWENMDIGGNKKTVGAKGSKAVIPNLSGPQSKPRNQSQLIENGSFVGKDSFIKGIFGPEKVLKEEKAVQDFFLSHIGKSIDSIVQHLETSDSVVNFPSLKELFHRKGVNMRFAWIVYAKLKREKARVMVGADILARCIKMILNESTSKRLKFFKKQMGMGSMDPMAQKKRMEEIKQDKINFFLEDFYKKILCQYINILVKDSFEGSEYENVSTLFHDLSTDLFLQRIKVMDIAKKCLDTYLFEFYLSSEIIKSIINIPCLHANVFIDAITHHSKICIQYEIVRQIRNDKYVHWVSNQGVLIKTTDFNILYSNNSHLTTYERCYLLLLKFLPNLQAPSQNSIELIVPAALYKLRRPRTENDQVSSFDCFLYDYYEVPNLEVLNDWVVLLESALNGLYTPDGQQNLLIEGYILQMILAFFGEEDNDNQLTLSILERINTFANNSPVISPELTVAIHTWYGILSESKLFVECEQSYSIALLILHKLYGDPRGRGGLGTPWELFITWRLSILSRLQGKLHDAEYSEELFDATLMNLNDNPMNAHVKSHYIYNNPFKAFQPSPQGNNNKQNELSHLTAKTNLKTAQFGDHPFPHWVNHLGYDETTAKIDTLNSTLQKTPQLLKWMINYIPTFQSTGVLWDTVYLREFFISIMHTSFSGVTLLSSLSNNSIERRERSSIVVDLNTTSKGYIRYDKKEEKFNPGGNLVQIFEKDASTFNKREINGTVYVWGQNDKGQVGTPICSVEDMGMSRMKKIRMYYPKRIVTLKDTIIQSVACGHSHSMAITLNGQLLAWGDNKYSQLGLGKNAPKEVYVPTIVSNLKDVVSVSCGHEHTVALTKQGFVYSWGEGEEGLLGHGETCTQHTPKRIEALRSLEIQAVVCGGLHTLALTKQGSVYAWGKGEGGQLGIPIDQLTKNSDKVYVTIPKRVRSALDGVVVVQIACGDAHSLALTQKGTVYSWGYTYQGQLGLGITSESIDPNLSCQVAEPTLIEKLASIKITEVYAGATFSLFLSDKKELYACGLNESNQLGIERSVKKISNHLDRMGPASAIRSTETSIPKKLDCFTSMPVLKASCGEAHSLALVLCDSSFMLFSWGMQKQGQLGLGDIQMPNSTPRPISFLQSAMVYSMACGAYHSMVVLGEPSKTFRKEALIERLEKSENRWVSTLFEVKGSYESMIELALNNLDNIIPSEEGKIDNPKAINKNTAVDR